ncbi:MAG: DUF3108 domain-containing protein [Chitinophagales bacterium]
MKKLIVLTVLFFVGIIGSPITKANASEFCPETPINDLNIEEENGVLVTAPKMVEVPYEQCDVKSYTYQNGEHLEYKVYYNWTALWLTAGRVVFDASESYLKGKTVNHLTAVGTSASSFSWFYTVEDRYETYIDPATSKPMKFYRNVQEGSYSLQNQLSFNHSNRQANIDYLIRKGETRTKDEKMDITECTQDLLSSIYYTRNLDYSALNVGDRVPIDLFSDGTIYNANLTYLGTDKLKTDFGTFRCIKVSPSLLESNAFDDEDYMVIWATDDKNRLPLLIESSIRVGSIKAYLQSYDNIKYPLTSKLK